MQIVIEIDEDDYERIYNAESGLTFYLTTLRLYRAIKNGTPLPKGHGKLIDARKLFKHLFVRGGKVCPDTDIDNFPTTFNARDIKNAILNATTIIEADMVESEK